jgi:methylated-DNA-[protein]-cysteine S-methyltransferase
VPAGTVRSTSHASVRNGPERCRTGTASMAVRSPSEKAVTTSSTGSDSARSGPFLTDAWEVLRTVPAGTPDTYAAFAARCGRPAAVRAAAGACARNAAALFVPCHRVLASGGGLGGFRWGTPVKRWLLDHEAAHAGS